MREAVGVSCNFNVTEAYDKLVRTFKLDNFPEARLPKPVYRSSGFGGGGRDRQGQGSSRFGRDQ